MGDGMTPQERDRLTLVEERVAQLHSDMSSVMVDVKSILSRIDTASGGWRALLLIVSIAGSLGAMFTALAHNLIGK